MALFLPPTKNIWRAPIRHTPPTLISRNDSFWPPKSVNMPNYAKFPDVSRPGYVPFGCAPTFSSYWDNCMALFLPQPKNIWRAPIRHTPNPIFTQKWPILGQNHPKNVPYGCAPKIFSLRSETLSIVHILYKNNHDRIKIAENRYIQGGETCY